MAKKEAWWVAKMEMAVAGKNVVKGELIRPTGARNDHLVFQDNSHWAYRFDGEPLECGSDGCRRLFSTAHVLAQHRVKVHGPERDARERAKVEDRQGAAHREAVGETIGGRPVVKEVPGPGGPVQYIEAR